MFNLMPFFATILQQNDEAATFIPLIIGCCCFFIIFVPLIVGMWKMFEKAGQPGWAALVPLYNLYILITEINGREPLFIVFFFVPLLNIYASVVMNLDLAKSYGKDTMYAIGLILVPFIFIPLLGFGDAQYTGPSAKGKELFEM